MDVRVRFRFNKRTGEVEEFLVDDQDRRLPEAVHDQVALEMAGVIVPYPEIQEVARARPALPQIVVTGQAGDEEPETRRLEPKR